MPLLFATAAAARQHEVPPAYKRCRGCLPALSLRAATNAGEWHGHPASGRRSTFSGGCWGRAGRCKQAGLHPTDLRLRLRLPSRLPSALTLQPRLGALPCRAASTVPGVSLLIFDAERDDQIREVICYRQPTAEERAHYMRPAEDQ